MEPEVILDKTLMRSWSRSRRSKNQTLTLVPTMGFLHEGHLSLIRTAKTLADLTVVSIYLNPTQFSPSEDLSTYPSDISGDLQKLSAAGVNAVFCPSDLYHSYDADDVGGHETWIRVERLEKGMCGNSRPAFFRGVATVVAKLFNIVEPDVAVFGKKDYQQWRVICRMVPTYEPYFNNVGETLASEERNVLEEMKGSFGAATRLHSVCREAPNSV